MPDHPTRSLDPDATAVSGEPPGGRPRPAPGGPAVVAGYELLDEVGRGGMGVVFRARDLALDREVAVKLLLPRFAPDSASAARFVGEARVTAQLQHPGIPAVYQVGDLPGGRPFLAMKLIKGRTLAGLLASGVAVDPLAVFEGVCQAVGYAHAHGVIHRDLKPSNVMVGAFGEVQVMDWGLAKVLPGGGRHPPESAPDDPEATARTEIRSPRDSGGPLTQTGSVVGTPAYMPPEQAAGETAKVGPRSDVFGLGAILCALLTGRPPYDGTDADAVRVDAIRGRTGAAFARLDASGAGPDVVALCKRCLAFDPADRPGSADEVAGAVAALRRAADERARAAERDRLAAEVRAGEQAKRRRAVQWAAGLVAAVLVLGIAGTTRGLVEARRQEAAAVGERDEKERARQAEADRAEGERRAKEEAEREKANAVAAQRREADRRAEADRQRARADEGFRLARGAVERYLAKVGSSPRLERAGLQTLRKELLEEAGTFYEELIRLQAGDPALKAEVAAALSAYAGVAQWTGAAAKAVERLERALALAEEVAADRPGDDAAQVRVAVLAQQLGGLVGPVDRAEACYRKALAVHERRAAAGAADADAGLAGAYFGYAQVCARAGRPDESVDLNEKSHRILARRHAADPNGVGPTPAAGSTGPGLGSPKNGEAAALINLGLAYRQVGRLAEAERALDRAAVLFREMSRDNPDGTWLRSGVGRSLVNLGEVYLATGRPARAEAAFQEVLAVYQELSARDPETTRWQESLDFTWQNLAEVYRATGRRGDAVDAAGGRVAVWEKLRAAYPAEGQYRVYHARALFARAGLLHESGRYAEAVAAWDQAVKLWPGLLPPATRLARAGSMAGAGDHARAAEVATGVLESSPLSAGDMYNAAGVLALAAGAAGRDATLGEDERARLGESYAAAAVGALRWAVDAGYRDRAHLEQDADLAAVRGRADFRALVETLPYTAPPPRPARR